MLLLYRRFCHSYAVSCQRFCRFLRLSRSHFVPAHFVTLSVCLLLRPPNRSQPSVRFNFSETFICLQLVYLFNQYVVRFVLFGFRLHRPSEKSQLTASVFRVFRSTSACLLPWSVYTFWLPFRIRRPFFGFLTIKVSFLKPNTSLF